MGRERPGSHPVSFAEYFKAARLKRALTQKEAGAHLGVTEWTVLNWEKGRTTPTIADLPTVEAFIGYSLAPTAQSLGERMREYRRRCGLTITEAATSAGVSEDGWAEWERTSIIRNRRCREAVDLMLASMG